MRTTTPGPPNPHPRQLAHAPATSPATLPTTVIHRRPVRPGDRRYHQPPYGNRVIEALEARRTVCHQEADAPVIAALTAMTSWPLLTRPDASSLPARQSLFRLAPPAAAAVRPSPATTSACLVKAVPFPTFTGVVDTFPAAPFAWSPTLRMPATSAPPCSSASL